MLHIGGTNGTSQGTKYCVCHKKAVPLHRNSEEPLDSCFLHAGAQHISSISRASFQSDQEASFILPDIIRRSINHRPHGLYIDQAWAIKKHLNYGKVQTY